MLVLSRKQGEQVVIDLGGRTIVVRVVGINRDRVRLGITAPEDITVHREEVWNQASSWHQPTEQVPSQREP
jgi:carbon storage regulator